MTGDAMVDFSVTFEETQGEKAKLAFMSLCPHKGSVDSAFCDTMRLSSACIITLQPLHKVHFDHHIV